MSQRQQYAVVPRDWLEDLAAQGPSKPDYWSACDQCERATAAAQDLITGETPPPEQLLDKTDIARIFRDIYGGNRYGESELLFAQAIERAVLKQLGAKNV